MSMDMARRCVVCGKVLQSCNRDVACYTCRRFLRERTCLVCGEQKPASEFHVKSNGISPSACKDCCRKQGNAYKAKASARNKALYGVAHHPLCNANAKDKLSNLRGLAIVAYGGVCSCCGESDFNKLSFDHINGNGRQDQNKGYTFYQRVMDAGYPNKEYRLLCWSCNFAYSHYGYCPHNGRPERVLSEQQRRRQNLKREMISAYGGRCAVCGETIYEFMTVDHMNGGGKQHRATMKSHNGFYYWLRRQGWLKDEYQLLCFNCNAVKGLGEKRTWGNHIEPIKVEKEIKRTGDPSGRLESQLLSLKYNLKTGSF